MSDNGKASTIHHQGLKIKELEHKNAELTKERDELVAHCEKLTGILDDLSKLHAADVFVKEPWEMTFTEVNAVLQQSPQQSLANLQADAVIAELEDLSMQEIYWNDAIEGYCIPNQLLLKRANQLREKAKL